MKLAELIDRTDLDVLDHVERSVTIPVLDGLQAQGDLIVIPMTMIGTVAPSAWALWRPVPADGLELVRGEAGTNPHILVADEDGCRWTPNVLDPLRLGIALFTNTVPAYLLHPEHGASGIAAGSWLVRRQQERGIDGRGPRSMMVAD